MEKGRTTISRANRLILPVSSVPIHLNIFKTSRAYKLRIENRTSQLETPANAARYVGLPFYRLSPPKFQDVHRIGTKPLRPPQLRREKKHHLGYIHPHHQPTSPIKTNHTTQPTAMATTASKPTKLPVTVDKPTPYTFDLGLLLANDPNPVAIPPSTNRAALETHLASVARDGAQVLINQLLTTCAINSTPAGVLLTLPPPQTALPREKPVPAPKAETKWSAFAKRRGIKPKTREQRRNQQYNESTGEFERRWGYKGANKAGQDDAIIEVSAAQEAQRKEGTSVRGDKRREIREKVKRNERRMRKNQRNAEGRK